ncbi:hypothetical protein D3C80_1214260 [compost metagenome]
MGNAFGQLNDDTAEIIHHRQQHAANVINLFGRDRIRVSRLKLTNGGHIPHAMNQFNNGFPYALTQHVLADHVGIRKGEQQCGLQRFDIHVQHGEDFDHLDAAP